MLELPVRDENVPQYGSTGLIFGFAIIGNSTSWLRPKCLFAFGLHIYSNWSMRTIRSGHTFSHWLLNLNLEVVQTSSRVLMFGLSILPSNTFNGLALPQIWHSGGQSPWICSR